MENISKAKIKWVRSLKLKKNREKERVFVVEGDKLVKDVIEHYPDLILFTVAIEKSTIPRKTYLAIGKEMKQMSALKTAPKSLAVVKFPDFKIKKTSFVLVLDGIQDPGNFGTIMRTADWFGVERIVCSKTTVDVFNPKVIQSSMGSVFRVKVDYTDLSFFLKESPKPIYGALLEGHNVYKTKLSKKGTLIIGNEGQGISEELKEFITCPITIPKFGGVESLNASISTGILLSEFKRLT